MDIALLGKCLLGALAVLLIQWQSGSRYFFVAGLVPLFPTFALIAHVVVGRSRSAADLQLGLNLTAGTDGAESRAWLAVYLLSVRLPLAATLLLATLCWLLAAGALLWGWQHWHA